MTKQVDELVAHLKLLSDDELRELASTAEWAYFMHRVYKLRSGDELTLERIEMDAQVCRQWPASTEYYKAQVELNQQRFQHSRVADRKRQIRYDPAAAASMRRIF